VKTSPRGVHVYTPSSFTFCNTRLRATGLAIAYKLIESAQSRWRAVNAPQLVALVRAGVKFEKGVMVERSEKQDTEVAA